MTTALNKDNGAAKFDPLSKNERSALMAKVTSKGNVSTEGKMMQILRHRRITGWRRNFNLPGNPDFAFPKQRVALFVDGCFWHGCPKCYRAPQTNTSYWSHKVARNKARDRYVRRKLREMGWHVISIWEHSLAKDAVIATRVHNFLNQR